MRLLYAAAALVQAVQAIDFSTNANISSWNQDDWTLTAHQYVPGQYQSRISLANGYVGASLAAAGPFFEVDVNQTDSNGTQPTNGWPLFDTRLSFSTISGFYNVQKNTTGTNFPWLTQYGWDSFISGIPHPTSIIFEFGDSCLDATVDNTTITNFKSSLSFKTGVAEWSYTWKPSKNPKAASFEVFYSVIFSRKRHNVVATKATITPTKDVNGTVSDLLDGRSALRSTLAARGRNVSRRNDKLEATLYAAVHPDNLPKTSGWVVSEADFPAASGNGRPAQGACVSSNSSSVAHSFDLHLKANKTATFYKYVGVASSDKFDDPEKTARSAASDAKSDGWDALVKEHKEEWAQIMTSDAVDDFSNPSTGDLPDDSNIEALQIGSVSSTFYILQNLLPDDGTGLNDNSLSVGGLASDSYAGQVFWDADYWVAPSLNLAFPDYAKQIANLRVKQHPQAYKNAEFNDWPNGTALFPWTTGRYGNCTATGPCVDYQYHLNHDIAFNILQLQNVTQNDTWFKNGPEDVVMAAAAMSAHLLQYDNKTQMYVIKNATDPDEYANHVNNPAFTLASSSQLLHTANMMLAAMGKPINELWDKKADNTAFPRSDANITLEYTGMNNSLVVKQADVVLISYPLGFEQNYTEKNSLTDLDYYSNKQSVDGPAMTWGAFSAVANAVSPSGCAAYTYALHAFLPYLRQPWYQFSEQQVDDPDVNGGTHPAFPFLTGHGGALQVGLFAFLGVRTDFENLYFSPSLPPQIPYLKVRKFYHAGATFHATMNTTHTNLTSSADVPILVGGKDLNSEATKLNLQANKTMTIENRMYFTNATYDNNLLQCLPVVSDDKTQAGQLAVGINDGATATAWQPENQDLARITVNTTSVEPRQVKGLHFDFGSRPFASATVWFYNVTAGVRSGNTIAVDNVMPNTPDPGPEKVIPVMGNTTTVEIPEAMNIWSGDFVQLTIEGCAGCEGGKGATVSEFAIY